MFFRLRSGLGVAVVSAKENTFEKGICPSDSVSVCQVSGCVLMSSEPWQCEAKLMLIALTGRCSLLQRRQVTVYKLHCFVSFTAFHMQNKNSF